ncbi:hypothetical protein EK904_002288 [Melospiza melodia maxima]|nr:hypothetical protein EK904_002288 [Melospiza melodia maxima]
MPIWTAVLLGLVLNPALADYSQQAGNNCQVSVGGVFQNLTLSSLTRVVVIEQRSNQFSWKTVWNYNTGIIATKLVQQNTCYISVMNRNEMPSFENLAHMASQNGNQMGLGRPSKKITFVTNGLVTNLSSYGIEISAMCSGVTTYMATEVHGVQGSQVNLGSCITLDVLRIVELDYCGGNGNWNGNIPSQQIPGGIFNNTQGNIFNHTQVIIGGNSQIVTINRQWRVAIIEQRSFTGSWKTIWNYNTSQQIPGGEGNSHLVIIGGQSQIVTINRQWRVAIIEKKAGIGSWKTIWNYNTGIIVTKVTQQNACYISTMNRNEMPLFDNLAHLAQESKNQFGLGRPTKKITFVTNGLVSNLRSYGSDVFSMCSGLTTYMTYEVHGVQGVIVTKVTQQNACYISTMNRNEMPRFDNLAHLAEESKNHIGFGRPTKKITFVASALVSNLRSYGSDVFSMCSGLTTYMVYEVHGVQGPQVNLGSCITLDVLQVVDLQYCSGNFHGNGQSQQIPGHNCHFSGACVFQNMTLSSQTHEVIFQQRSEQFSWKTIWNYNTGIIATKVVQERTCYISTMNRSEMPTFDALVRFAADNKKGIGMRLLLPANLRGEGRD